MKKLTPLLTLAALALPARAQIAITHTVTTPAGSVIAIGANVLNGVRLHDHITLTGTPALVDFWVGMDETDANGTPTRWESNHVTFSVLRPERLGNLALHLPPFVSPVAGTLTVSGLPPGPQVTMGAGSIDLTGYTLDSTTTAVGVDFDFVVGP